MKGNKGRKFPSESLRHDEVRALLEVCGETWVGKRNRALIVVMWRAGLRLDEALSLESPDIDWDSQAIRVLHGKGDKARTVAIDRPALEVIKQWLNASPVTYTRGVPVFCTQDGGKIDQSYIRVMLPRLARRAGIQRRIHAHMFRHTFAVELTREGVPMPLIQQLLGHSSLATTSLYLASLSPEEALDRVRGRTW